MAAGLTRPTPARQDAPFRGQGREGRPKMILPSLPVYVIPGMAWMSPPLRAFFQFPITCSRVAWSILDCARRTSTFLSCAFREQEDD